MIAPTADLSALVANPTIWIKKLISTIAPVIPQLHTNSIAHLTAIALSQGFLITAS
jgi:hypothetical protein